MYVFAHDVHQYTLPQLLSRAHREMRDANRATDPSYWWSAVVTSVAYLVLYDVFLLLLLLKLDKEPQLPWAVVALPLWMVLIQSGGDVHVCSAV
jgi:ABC-type polysaccharide/polyol phosphate export permease